MKLKKSKRNYTQLVQLIPPPPTTIDGTPYLSWNGSIMTFYSADTNVAGTINFNGDTIVGASINSNQPENVNYASTNVSQS